MLHSTHSISSFLSAAPLGAAPPPSILHGHSSHARSLRLRHTLRAHHGCVNRLSLSPDRSNLLSGSDDCSLCVWDVRSAQASPTLAHTLFPGHDANILAVSFLDATRVLSGGMDCLVVLSDVATARPLSHWSNHTQSVKTLAALSEHTFLSAANDATARLFDVRAPQNAPSSSSVLLRVSDPLSASQHSFLPLNSALPSPVCSHHMLVACNDATLRIFDTRAAGPNSQPIESYAPAHLRPNAPEMALCASAISATYANFSSDGRRIVANYLCDAVSVVTRSADSSASPFFLSPVPGAASRLATRRFEVDMLRNALIKDFTAAVSYANRLLSFYPTHTLATVCKAYALLKRKQLCDYRAAYGLLQSVIDHLRAYPTAVDHLCAPGATEQGRDASLAIWLNVFEYMQTVCLSRIIPSVYLCLQYPSKSVVHTLMLRRLQYMSRKCKKVEEFREQCGGAVTTSSASSSSKSSSSSSHSHSKNIDNITDIKSKTPPTSSSSSSLPSDQWLRYLKSTVLGDSVIASDRDTGEKPHPRSSTPNSAEKFRTQVLGVLLDNLHNGLVPLRQLINSRIMFMRPEDPDTGQASAGHTSGSRSVRALPNRLLIQYNSNYCLMTPLHMLDRLAGSDNEAEDEGDYEDDDEGESEMNNEDEWPFDVPLSQYPRRASMSLDPDDLWGDLTTDPQHTALVGHTSKLTEIKEANFFGAHDQLVLAGSDDGCMYVWNVHTTEVLARVRADEKIVNCVLPHPYENRIFASGIDKTIKVITP